MAVQALFKRWSVGAIIAVAASFTTASPVHALACGDTITTKTVMTADLDCSAYVGTAVTIGAGGSLDMAGHTIGACSSGNHGIDIMASSVSLANGVITGCSTGVFVDNASAKARITNIVSIGHKLGPCNGGLANGIALSDKSAKLINGVVTGCSTGVQIAGTGGNRITNIVATGNFYGFMIGAGSDGNKLLDTAAIGNSSVGYVILSSKNHLTNAAAMSNGGNGFQTSGDKNTFTRCVADSNTGGFSLSGEKVALTDSVVSFNNADGITASGDSHKYDRAMAITNGGAGFVVGAPFTKINNSFALKNAAGFYVAGSDAILASSKAFGHNADGFLIDAPRAKATKLVSSGNGYGITLSSGTVDSKISGSLTDGNTFSGIQNAGGNAQRITKNVALGNATFDMSDSSASCSATWGGTPATNNLFGTANQTCIH